MGPQQKKYLLMHLNQKAMSTYCDANLMHDLVMGRPASSILRFFNQTPMDWFPKHQNQVKSATYGSEFMVAHQAVEQIIDLHYTLHMLGVPIDGPCWLFGDIKLVVTSSTIPHSTLNRHWNTLSYHKVHEVIAGNIVQFEHIPTLKSPSDILMKPLLWHKAWVHVEPLLFWKAKH